MTTRKGRPTKFAPETRNAIIKRLQAGATVKATCDSVGIGDSTYYEWVEIGRAHVAGLPHARMPRALVDRQPYADFAEATTRAQADGMIRAAIVFRQGMEENESESVTTEATEETRVNSKTGEVYAYRKTITKRTVTRTPGDWRAAMEYLARRDPEHWARSAPQKHEIDLEGTIILKTGMNMDEL